MPRGGRLSTRRALDVWTEFSGIVHRPATNRELLAYIKDGLSKRTREPFLEGAKFANKYPVVLGRPKRKKKKTNYEEEGGQAPAFKRRTAANFLQQGRRIGHAAEREFHSKGPAAAAALAARRSERVLNRRGRGITDYLPEFIRRRLPWLRSQAPPQVREIVKSMGSTPIVSVSVCREPISSAITVVGNWLTLGRLDRVRKALNYDNLYHLFMVLHFQNGATLRLEKNQVLSLYPKGESGQTRVAGDPRCDLKTLLERGEKVAGTSSYFRYSPERDNCQKFCVDTLKGSGILTSDLQNWILQDAEKLLPPGLVRRIANAATDVAARVDRTIHGEGRFRMPVERIVLA